METKYQYNDITHILTKDHFGVFSYDNIVETWDYAIDNSLIPCSTKGFFIDFSEATLDLRVGQEKKLINYFDTKPDFFKDKKIAVIVNTPQEIIFPLMVENSSKTFILKAFSTRSAAENWLLHT